MNSSISSHEAESTSLLIKKHIYVITVITTLSSRPHSFSHFRYFCYLITTCVTGSQTSSIRTSIFIIIQPGGELISGILLPFISFNVFFEQLVIKTCTHYLAELLLGIVLRESDVIRNFICITRPQACVTWNYSSFSKAILVLIILFYSGYISKFVRRKWNSAKQY